MGIVFEGIHGGGANATPRQIDDALQCEVVTVFID